MKSSLKKGLREEEQRLLPQKNNVLLSKASATRISPSSPSSLRFVIITAVLSFASSHVLVQALILPPSTTPTKNNARRTDTAIIPASYYTIQLSPSKLYSTTEEEQGNEEKIIKKKKFPPPRRTRRIDEVLFGGDNDAHGYPLEENIDDDDKLSYNDLTMSVLSLESSLKKERDKSTTLAIRLAKAERMIEDQNRRLETKRASLADKDDALTQIQRKLEELERKLELQERDQHQQQQQKKKQAETAEQTPMWDYASPKLSSKERQYPMISYWTLNGNTGEVKGVVTCHPSIPDGTTIVTSSLSSSCVSKAGIDFVCDPEKPATIITTQTGSKYQLGVRRQQTNTASQYVPRATSSNSKQPVVDHTKKQRKKEMHRLNKLYPHLEYPLTGQMISNGLGTKYLLAGEPKQKPSGRSIITMAYQSDDQARPINTNKVYVIKLSTHKDKLKREYDNYCRIQDGLSDHIIDNNKIGRSNGGHGNGHMGGNWVGNIVSSVFDARSTTQSYEQYQQSMLRGTINPFVKCYDLLPDCQGSIMYAQHSALVMEKGYKDLRDYVIEMQKQQKQQGNVATGMATHLVQRSLLTAAKCLDTLHCRARLVYTDLKAENLIFMKEHNDSDNDDVDVIIKGIDLESCIPVKGHPIDYTPEVCPPEFAKYHVNGNSYEFVVEYTFDVWSFGMVAYELATGSPYFKGKTPKEIMKLLNDPNFIPPTGDTNDNSSIIHDKLLHDLIGSCLRINPKQRITVPQILKHPYFKQRLSS